MHHGFIPHVGEQRRFLRQLIHHDLQRLLNLHHQRIDRRLPIAARG